MTTQTLKSTNDVYKNIKINRCNTNYYKAEVKVKYYISYKGVDIYFMTQNDVKAFIDTITT